MNPIPLSAPDGTVYAYACGVCRHVPVTGEMLVRADDEDVAHFADDSHAYATACCTCSACRGPLVEDEGRGRPWCLVCRTKEAERIEAARRAALENSGVICAICGGAESDYCRATPKCIDCDEDHGGSPGGRCRDCDIEYLHGLARPTPSVPSEVP